MILFVAMVVSLPTYFHYVESRNGAYLHDLILQAIPAFDVSVPIFLIIWSVSGLVIWRCVNDPIFALQMLSSFLLLSLVRMASIILLPLEPPNDLIVLKDPLTSLIYGGKDVFMKKDLFFSGHTSNMFLMYLCLERKRDKIIALAATILVAIGVLIQHVHYSIDVMAAFVFTYCVYRVGKWIASI
jgi:membrane-associated phospholipid phosphatase